MRARRALLATAAAVLAACASSTDSGPTAGKLSVLSGDKQTGFTGSTLSLPLVVKVLSDDDQPVANAVVDFAVQSGTATISPAADTTDASGQAQTNVTGGSSAGTVVITATVHSTSINAVFTATLQASADASCTGVTPITMTLGEVRTALAGNLVCLTGTAATEYMVHAFYASTVASASTQFSVTGSGITAATGTDAAPVSRPLLNVSGVGSLSLAPSRSLQARHDARLRQLERSLGSRIPAARSYMANHRRALRSSAPPAVGTFINFNADEECNSLANPDIRTGRVVAVTSTAIVVADTSNPAGGFSDAEYQSVGVTFDTLVTPVDTSAFGNASDIDNNQHVIIFYTSAVNKLTPQGANGVVEGFFNPRDLFPTTGSTAGDHCSASNFAEMFYVLVPDPNGTINGNTRTKVDVQQLTIDVTVHEYQHLINAARRIANNADDFEEVWLNEGLSHIAEELLFYRSVKTTPRQNIGGPFFTTQARVDAFNEYMSSNFGRFDLFLSAPSANSPYADNDSLETRGGIWSFLRYAADRASPSSDGTLWRQLVNSTTTGMANLSNVFGSPIVNQFRDWSIAVYSDDLVGTTANYQWSSWNIRSMYADGFQAPFPLARTVLVNTVPRTVTLVAGGSAYSKVAVGAGATAGVAWTTTAAQLQVSIVRTK